MLAGHYAPSFALRHGSPVPLWVLFLAAQLVDIVWAALIILDVEQVTIDIANYPMSNPLALILEYMPYSHGLVATMGWAVLAAIFGGMVWNLRGGLVIGACVVSHWFLDLLVHKPDLPLTGQEYALDLPLYGFDLWQRSLVGAFLLEAGLLLGAVAIYGRRACIPKAFWIFAFLMLAVQAVSALALPIPTSPFSLGLTQLGLYFGLALAAWWIERRWG